MQYCGGGELYGLLMSQPNKRLSESHMRFYVAEILLALQYLHLLGFVYRCSAPPPAQHLRRPFKGALVHRVHHHGQLRSSVSASAKSGRSKAVCCSRIGRAVIRQQVLMALDVRRDLKPENILLSASGHALLTDFDLSFCSDGTTPKMQRSSPQRPAPGGSGKVPARPLACLPAALCLNERRVIPSARRIVQLQWRHIVLCCCRCVEGDCCGWTLQL